MPPAEVPFLNSAAGLQAPTFSVEPPRYFLCHGRDNLLAGAVPSCPGRFRPGARHITAGRLKVVRIREKDWVHLCLVALLR